MGGLIAEYLLSAPQSLTPNKCNLCHCERIRSFTMNSSQLTRRGFLLAGVILTPAPIAFADETAMSFQCFVTGQLNEDLVAISENGESLLSGFVSTSPILGVALSFRLNHSTGATLLTVDVGIDPDQKTTSNYKCEPSKGRYIMIAYQGKNQLKITQSKTPPLFK